MKKMMTVLPGFLFVAIFLICGKVFATENVNADMASVGEMKATEANLESVSEDEAPVDEELKDEEVVDADA